MSSIIIGMLALAGAALAYVQFESYIVAILVAIIVVLIGKQVQPYVLLGWDKLSAKLYPLPETKEFFSQGLDPQEDYETPPQMLGMRVAVFTEQTPCNHKTRADFEAMVQQALDALEQQHPLFRLRLSVVKRRQFPVQYAWSLCETDGSLLKRCVISWLRTPALREMKQRQKERDLFLYDGEHVMSGTDTPIRYTVMVLFDGNLPVTLPKEEQTAVK